MWTRRWLNHLGKYWVVLCLLLYWLSSNWLLAMLMLRHGSSDSSVSPAVVSSCWSRWKYLDISWLHIKYANDLDNPDFSSRASMKLTFVVLGEMSWAVEWISIKFSSSLCTYVLLPVMQKPNALFNYLDKQIKMPSAWAVLLFLISKCRPAKYGHHGKYCSYM